MALSDFFFSARYLVTGIVVYIRYRTNTTFHIQDDPRFCIIQAITFQVNKKNLSVVIFSVLGHCLYKLDCSHFFRLNFISS